MKLSNFKQARMPRPMPEERQYENLHRHQPRMQEDDDCEEETPSCQQRSITEEEFRKIGS